MTVYVEIVMLNNFFISLFLLIATLSIIKMRINYLWIVALSALCSLVFTFIGLATDNLYIKTVLYAVLPPLFCAKYGNVKKLCAGVFIYILMWLALTGVSLLVAMKSNYGFYQYKGTFLPTLTYITLLTLTISSVALGKNLTAVRQANRHLYRVKITCNDRTKFALAYYDTGNNVYTKNGESVVMVGERLYNSFGIVGGESISISTVSGYSEIEVSPMKMTVFGVDGEDKEFCVSAGKVKDFDGEYSVLLHGAMLEVI